FFGCGEGIYFVRLRWPCRRSLRVCVPRQHECDRQRDEPPNTKETHEKHRIMARAGFGVEVTRRKASRPLPNRGCRRSKWCEDDRAFRGCGRCEKPPSSEGLGWPRRG